jgi:hypothetical protein
VGGGVGRSTVETPAVDEPPNPLEQLSSGHHALDVFGTVVDVEIHCEERIGTLGEHFLGEDPALVHGQEDHVLLRDFDPVDLVGWEAAVDFARKCFGNSLEACWRRSVADDQLPADSSDILLLMHIFVDHVPELERKALQVEAVFLPDDVWGGCGSGSGSGCGEWGGSHDVWGMGDALML